MSGRFATKIPPAGKVPDGLWHRVPFFHFTLPVGGGCFLSYDSSCPPSHEQPFPLSFLCGGSKRERKSEKERERKGKEERESRKKERSGGEERAARVASPFVGGDSQVEPETKDSAPLSFVKIRHSSGWLMK